MGETRKGSVPQGIGPTFEDLLRSIRGVDAELATQAKRAVNVRLTLRNWLIGYYIAEYEQNGADRARYGAKLLENLSARLVGLGVSAWLGRRTGAYQDAAERPANPSALRRHARTRSAYTSTGRGGIPRRSPRLCRA